MKLEYNSQFIYFFSMGGELNKTDLHFNNVLLFVLF